ncbi:unnamed protein product [Gadus morhua 'NCC']
MTMCDAKMNGTCREDHRPQVASLQRFFDLKFCPLQVACNDGALVCCLDSKWCIEALGRGDKMDKLTSRGQVNSEV